MTSSKKKDYQVNIILSPHYTAAIEIFNSSRGAGGTLAYPVKINQQQFFFEIDDEGNWRPCPSSNDIPEESLSAIDNFLRMIEKKTRKVRDAR